MIDRIEIKYRIKYILGGTSLGRHYFIFLLVHTLFLVFTRIPSVFINTLLMNQTGDVNATLFYNGAIFAACALTMLFSAQIMHWTECRITAAIGIIGYNLLYLCYVLFQSYIGEVYLLFGLFNGMADGFYYISYGRMVLAYTEIENRDSGMGIINTFSAVVNLSVPFLAGGIISVIGGTKGYVTVFVLAFTVAFCTLLAVFHLPKEKKKESKVSVHYLRFIKLLKRKPHILWSLLAETVKGIREGTFLFILNIILYQLIRKEILVGFNSFLTGLASICCFWFMSHFIRPGNRRKYMIKAVMILLTANFLCIYAVTPVVIMLFSVINSFFAGMLEVSCYTTFFDVTESIEEMQEYTPELLAFHEVFVVSGRCIGLLFFAVINTLSGATVKSQVFSLFVLTFIQFFTVYCCKKASEVEHVY